MKPGPSKYTRWHDAIIERARDRILEGYSERHHVLPRSLGGTNLKSNIVRLTCREHFLVHWLLAKMTCGDDRRKMLWALSKMQSTGKGERKLKSWQYEIARRASSEAMRTRIISEETRAKLSEHLKTKPAFIEAAVARLKQLAVARIGTNLSPEYGAAISAGKKGKSNGLEGRKYPVKHCAAISQAKTGRPPTPVQVAGYAKAANKNRGRKQSSEERAMRSVAQKARWSRDRTQRESGEQQCLL